MLDKTKDRAGTDDDIDTGVRDWLDRFEHTLRAHDATALKSLFHADSYWRDVLAFTWTIRTVHGADAIAGELKALARKAGAEKFQPRSGPHRAARGYARRHEIHRGDFLVRDRDRARFGRAAPFGGSR